jgi:hypothetical protein
LYSKSLIYFLKYGCWLNPFPSNCFQFSVAGVGYAPSFQGRSLNGQIADPAFVQVPSFNPHPNAYDRQQQQDSNGWSYSFGYPSPIALEDASSKQARRSGNNNRNNAVRQRTDRLTQTIIDWRKDRRLRLDRSQGECLAILGELID